MNKLFCGFFALMISVSSYAGIECTGSVTGLTMAPNGQVYMQQFKNWDWMRVCSVSERLNNTDPEACKAIYSLLLTAQMTQKSVTFWFSQGGCASESQSSWQFLDNWYFGPKLVD